MLKKRKDRVSHRAGTKDDDGGVEYDHRAAREDESHEHSCHGRALGNRVVVLHAGRKFQRIRECASGLFVAEGLDGIEAAARSRRGAKPKTIPIAAEKRKAIALIFGSNMNGT